MKNKVNQVLNKIRPSLQRDGGDVKLIDVTKDGVVRVELQGACSECKFLEIAINNLIETTLKNEISEVKDVVRL